MLPMSTPVFSSASSEAVSLEQPPEQWLGHGKHVLGSGARQRPPESWEHGHAGNYESDLAAEETLLW